MGIMQPPPPTGHASEDAKDFLVEEEGIAASLGIDAAMVEGIDTKSASLHQWPKAVADLYETNVANRMFREGNFLFLLGLLTCLLTIVIDALVNPGMVTEGVLLRVLAVGPITLLGLMASRAVGPRPSPFASALRPSSLLPWWCTLPFTCPLTWRRDTPTRRSSWSGWRI